MAQQGVDWLIRRFPIESLPNSLLHGVGDGLGADGTTVAGAANPVCRAAAGPKLLKTATAIPNWSSVMGPIDSTM
jgi:hypothetical protein